MVVFSKPAVTPKDLLEKLKSRNLIVPDERKAIKYITFVGYYRLKGYWFHLTDVTTQHFKPNTTFDILVNRYECDRELRALILEGIERLEVAIRNTICNFLSLKYSPHWFLNLAIFKPTQNFGIGQMLSKIESEVGRANEKLFISSYKGKYCEPYLPPSWAMSECVTFGIWSRIYQIIADPADKKSISSKFGISSVEAFGNWLHVISYIRNSAAHHDRMLNNPLRVSPLGYPKKNIKFSNNRTMYAGLTVIHVLLEAIEFNTTFKSAIQGLEVKYGVQIMQELGFPKNWPAGATGW